jgi:hypothetical protein
MWQTPYFKTRASADLGRIIDFLNYILINKPNIHTHKHCHTKRFPWNPFITTQFLSTHFVKCTWNYRYIDILSAQIIFNYNYNAKCENCHSDPDEGDSKFLRNASNLSFQRTEKQWKWTAVKSTSATHWSTMTAYCLQKSYWNMNTTSKARSYY